MIHNVCWLYLGEVSVNSNGQLNETNGLFLRYKCNKYKTLSVKWKCLYHHTERYKNYCGNKLCNKEKITSESDVVNEHCGGSGGGAKCGGIYIYSFDFACLFFYFCAIHLKRISLPNRLLFVICCVWKPFDSSFSGELPVDCINNRFWLKCNFVLRWVVVRVWFSLVEQQLDVKVQEYFVCLYR